MRTPETAQRTYAPGEITRKSPSRYCTLASPSPAELNLFSTLISIPFGRPSHGQRTLTLYMNAHGNGSALWCNRDFLTNRKVKPHPFVISCVGRACYQLPGRSPMRTLTLLCSVILILVAEASQAAPLAIDLPADEGTIHAWLFKPAEGGPFPAVIAAHGCTGLGGRSGPVQMRYQKWAELLNKAGFAVLFPDSYGSRNLGPH